MGKPCTENWPGALYAEAVRCMLPVGREIKTEIQARIQQPLWSSVATTEAIHSRRPLDCARMLTNQHVSPLARGLRQRHWLWALRILSVFPMLIMGTVGAMLVTEFLRNALSHLREPSMWLYLVLMLVFSVSGCLPYALTLWFARGSTLRSGGKAAALAAASFWYALCGVLTLEPLIDRANLSSHGRDELGFVEGLLVVWAHREA